MPDGVQPASAELSLIPSFTREYTHEVGLAVGAELGVTVGWDVGLWSHKRPSTSIKGESSTILVGERIVSQPSQDEVTVDVETTEVLSEDVEMLVEPRHALSACFNERLPL